MKPEHGLANGNLFTKYRLHGFRSRAAAIELRLLVIAREVQDAPEAPPWLQAAAEDRRLHTTAGFDGFASAELDALLRGEVMSEPL